MNSLLASLRAGARAWACGALAAVLLLGVGVGPAWADDHDPGSSAHPLEVIGALLYPVGWLVDTVVVRPLHWLANHEPVATLSGHRLDPEPKAPPVAEPPDTE